MPERQRSTLATLQALCLKVGRAWAIKENLRCLWTYRREGWARRFFQRWFWWATHSRLAPVCKVAHMLRNRLGNIRTYCRHAITNGAAEGLNSKIMTIKRRACGYRNKEHFKTAIYFFCGGRISTHADFGRTIFSEVCLLVKIILRRGRARMVATHTQRLVLGGRRRAVEIGLVLRPAVLCDAAAADLWRTCIQLAEAKAAFRIQKSDLSIRPIWQQRADRACAHIFVCFLAYVPDRAQAAILDRLGLNLPQSLRPPRSLKM